MSYSSLIDISFDTPSLVPWGPLSVMAPGLHVHPIKTYKVGVCFTVDLLHRRYSPEVGYGTPHLLDGSTRCVGCHRTLYYLVTTHSVIRNPPNNVPLSIDSSVITITLVLTPNHGETEPRPSGVDPGNRKTSPPYVRGPYRWFFGTTTSTKRHIDYPYKRSFYGQQMN